MRPRWDARAVADWRQGRHARIPEVLGVEALPPSRGNPRVYRLMLGRTRDQGVGGDAVAWTAGMGERIVPRLHQDVPAAGVQRGGRDAGQGTHIRPLGLPPYTLRRLDWLQPIYSPAPTITAAPIQVVVSGNSVNSHHPTATEPSSWKYWKGETMLAGA